MRLALRLAVGLLFAARTAIAGPAIVAVGPIALTVSNADREAAFLHDVL